MCSGFGGWKKSFRRSFRKRSASAKASAIFRAHSGNHFSEIVASRFPTLFPYLINVTRAPIILTAHLCTSTGTTLVQTPPGYEPGAGRIRQPRNSSGLQHRWRVRLVGVAGRVYRCAPWPGERCARRRRRCCAGAVADSGI